MIPYNYELVMIVANLAKHRRKFGFAIKLTLLNAFLNGNWFCTSNGTVPFEVATNRMGYNAFINGTKPTKDWAKIHMIRMGVLWMTILPKN